MMKNQTILLAGRTYVIESLKFKAEREWRKKYDAPISALINSIAGIQKISGKEFEKTTDLIKEIGLALLANSSTLMQALLDMPDILFAALCDYSPTIQADRAFIEENAYQEEIASAFLEVLKIVYPFGALLGIVRSLGSTESSTMPNSPAPNGASGKTISMKSN